MIECILNPKLIAAELVKRFGNMDRILENVTTYYFENFLNLNERNIIATDMQNIQNMVLTLFLALISIEI
jgi:hypothetical protein